MERGPSLTLLEQIVIITPLITRSTFLTISLEIRNWILNSVLVAELLALESRTLTHPASSCTRDLLNLIASSERNPRHILSLLLVNHQASAEAGIYYGNTALEGDCCRIFIS